MSMWIPNDILVVFSLIPVSAHVVLSEATDLLAASTANLSLDSHGIACNQSRGLPVKGCCVFPSTP